MCMIHLTLSLFSKSSGRKGIPVTMSSLHGSLVNAGAVSVFGRCVHHFNGVYLFSLDIYTLFSDCSDR